MSRHSPVDAETIRQLLADAMTAIEEGEVDRAFELLRSGGPQLRELAAALGMDAELDELEGLLDNNEAAGDAGPVPMLTQIDFADFNPLSDPALNQAWSAQIRAAGYDFCGDFVGNELPLAMQVFYRAPSTYAVISELGGKYHWVEVQTSFADQSTESWSNAPFHDDNAPPWSTHHLMPNAPLHELLKAAEAPAVKKPLAVLDPTAFAAYFEASCKRSSEWRGASK